LPATVPPMTAADFLQALLRMQFGLSASFHFLFVPLSIGLLWQVCWLRTAHARQPSASHLLAAAQHWQRFFTLTWAVGIATGYPLRAQLQANWAGYIGEASQVLATIFQVEGDIAPGMFLLVALLSLAGGRLPAWLGALASWALLGLMAMQALTILAVNAWMQAPDVPHDLWHLLTSPTALHKWVHTLTAAVLCGAFFAVVLSAMHLRRSHQREAAQASIRLACCSALGAICLALLSGHDSASLVAQTQPRKFAAFEAHWQADARWAPMVLWARPDEQHGRNQSAVEVPGLMGMLMATSGQAPAGLLDLERLDRERLLGASSGLTPNGDALAVNAQGLDTSMHWQHDPDSRALLLLRNAVAAQSGEAWLHWDDDQRAQAVARAAHPPVMPVFVAFRVMVASGMACLVLSLLAFWRRSQLASGQAPRLMRAMSWALPLPWVAIISGWCVAEIGRQPWTITGVLTTYHASLLPTLEHGVVDALIHLVAALLIALVYTSLCVALWRIGPRVGIWGTVTRWWRQPTRRAVVKVTPTVVREVDAELDDAEEAWRVR
jgi:cytochrome d ubiquinol oxidase subunit I